MNSQNTGNLHYDYMSSQNLNKLSTLTKKPTLFIKHNTDDVHDLDFIHLMTYTVCIMLVMHMILITTTDNCL